MGYRLDMTAAYADLTVTTEQGHATYSLDDTVIESLALEIATGLDGRRRATITMSLDGAAVEQFTAWIEAAQTRGRR